MKVLVINAGSSSLKYQLFEMDTEEVLAKGLCERIGIDGRLVHEKGGEKSKFDIPMETHAEAIKAVIETLTDSIYGVISDIKEIDAVGHRVVHGGEYFSDSVVIDEKVMKAINDCVPLAPLHNPPNIIGIDAVTAVLGAETPQIAVFDTAFHQTMPATNFMYSIPYEYYEKYQIRKYGFHGTSHKYVSEKAADMLGKPISETRLITCHLGNGASIAAVLHGKSVDTSMGFTPLDGLPMGTRSGSIDPGIISFICEQEHIAADEVINILNKRSGVLGISGISSDFRDLESAASEGDTRAMLATSVFVSNVKKIIGGYAMAMGGVDAIVFTAGVGENDKHVRAAVCNNMEFFGIEIDNAKNDTRGKRVDISSDYARVKTFVIPTNEELVIARDTKRLISK
ncbi:MAG: acetate kinase [Clostridia bacterium]